MSDKVPNIPGLTVTRGAPLTAEAIRVAATPASGAEPPAEPAAEGWPSRYSPGERRRLAAKLTTVVPDNGMVHWGAGMPGTLCGVQSRPRKEESINRAKVTCPGCQKILRTRP